VPCRAAARASTSGGTCLQSSHEDLKELTKLQSLNLPEQITDAGFDHLKGLTNLTDLYLLGTQVTDAGVAELKKALPNCEIQRRLGP
jgi:hypothetical protein